MEDSLLESGAHPRWGRDRFSTDATLYEALDSRILDGPFKTCVSDELTGSKTRLAIPAP
jgi:hypothetical protein